MLGNKKSNSINGRFYQSVIIYHKQIKVGFHHEPLTYTFYAPIIFDEPAKATKFLTQYVKDMVASGDLPKDSIKNGELNEEVAKGAVQELILANLELKDEGD